MADVRIRQLLGRAAGLIARRLPRGGVGRNATWIFGGQAVGLAATLVATPIQLDRMGAERYGVVVITAATVGSLLIADAGAGWAVMRAVPWHRARGGVDHARALAGSGAILSLLAGSLAGLVLWLLSEDLVGVLRLSEDVRPDAVAAFHVIAFLLPLVMFMGVLAAVARAAGLFALTATSSAFTSVALNVTWAVVAGSEDDIVKVARAQIAIMAVALLWLAGGVRLRAPAYMFPLRASLRGARELLSFGGKSSISIGSLNLLNQADKVALGAVLPVSVLPAYSIPFSVALRITLASSSLGTVLLPRMAAINATGDRDEARRVGMMAFRTIAILSAAMAVTAAFAGGAFLEVWVDSDFAADAWGPLIALSVGFAALATGAPGQTMLDSAGRAGVNALLTLAGAAVGLALGLGLAAAYETALAAAVGVATGLTLIGLGALEVSRRLVLQVPWTTLARVVGAPWIVLTAAAAAAFGASQAVSAPPLVTIGAVGAAALGAATAEYARRMRAPAPGLGL